MGLEEMEAYAAQALKIDSLERQVKALQFELEARLSNSVPLEVLKSWLMVGKDYCFLSDLGKEATIRMFGEGQ